jgi:hypothetical protein
MSDAVPGPPANDVDLPMQARVILWATSAARGVLSAAAAKGLRLDVEEDRDEVALDVTAAVLRHLKSAGNKIVLPEPPATASQSTAAQEADRFSLADLVKDLMKPDEENDSPTG